MMHGDEVGKMVFLKISFFAKGMKIVEDPCCDGL